ncbi:MAG: LAGLIDADG family homing endonuclease [Candidatus Buchananbacteria bacterium]
MDRIIFKKGLQNKFLFEIKLASSLNNKELGNLCSVHGHTIGDWMKESSSMPFDIADKLSQKFNIDLPDYRVESSSQRLSRAGKIGGRARFEKYGILGDIESRRRGGTNSQIIHKLLGTDFKQRKKIKNIRRSLDLAEFIGIMLGDGGIANYHISISLNSSTDLKYSAYVVRLSEKLFGLKARKYFREKTCLNVCIAGVGLVEYLIGQGLSHNKVADQVGVPLWITNEINYRRACLKGLIDTDGSVYVDRHKGLKHNYASVCLDFSNRSLPLLDFVYDTLVLFDLHPRKYKFSIKLRKAADVVKYFEKIGSSNAKHKDRYKFFRKKYGEVA